MTVQAVFSKRLCRWQYQLSENVDNGRHVILDVGTGMGKTLAFFVLSLFCPGRVQIIITALNVLGQQNEDQLRAAGISAISVTAETATDNLFAVNSP